MSDMSQGQTESTEAAEPVDIADADHNEQSAGDQAEPAEAPSPDAAGTGS